MNKRIRQHEEFIVYGLNIAEHLEQAANLYTYHTKMTGDFQIERFIHLVVTLSVGLFAILFVLLTVLSGNIVFLAVVFPLLLLFMAYLLHYYHLENSIQRLYYLDKLIMERIEELEQ